MVDVVDAATRSRMMAGIRGKNTRPEVAVRRALHAEGFRFRLQRRDLPGRPDVHLPKWNAAIFIHGCFWHRHPGCRYTTTPATRPEFWHAKFDANVARDRRNVADLRARGVRVAILWECSLRGDRLPITIEQTCAWLRDCDEMLETLPDQASSVL